jgi:5-methylcytosine-specific restriction endonuclease McrA
LRQERVTESGELPEYFSVYRRDAFRCTSPVCTRSDVTPHHLVFRSHGGGDEDENVASLCVWCHLHGIHEGRIAAEPPASKIRWRIGRTATVRVDGRVRH